MASTPGGTVAVLPPFKRSKLRWVHCSVTHDTLPHALHVISCSTANPNTLVTGSQVSVARSWRRPHRAASMANTSSCVASINPQKNSWASCWKEPRKAPSLRPTASLICSGENAERPAAMEASRSARQCAMALRTPSAGRDLPQAAAADRIATEK